jgi:hypothetical protein
MIIWYHVIVSTGSPSGGNRKLYFVLDRLVHDFAFDSITGTRSRCDRNDILEIVSQGMNIIFLVILLLYVPVVWKIMGCMFGWGVRNNRGAASCQWSGSYVLAIRCIFIVSLLRWLMFPVCGAIRCFPPRSVYAPTDFPSLTCRRVFYPCFLPTLSLHLSLPNRCPPPPRSC